MFLFHLEASVVFKWASLFYYSDIFNFLFLKLGTSLLTTGDRNSLKLNIFHSIQISDFSGVRLNFIAVNCWG